MSHTKPVFDIKNLSLFSGEKVIFKGLTLAIERHAITAIVGPSGIGKSSLLQVLNQMIKDEESLLVSGEVLFCDEHNASIDLLNLHEEALPSLRRNVVYVSQHPDLLPFSIADNVAFGLRLQGYSKAVIDEKVMNALKKVHLWDEVNERLSLPAHQLSGGQQQRLILARALVLSPLVLLLDEPTASLNEELTMVIESLLCELKQTMSIVLVSHFKEQVARIADHVYEMSKVSTSC